MHLNPYFILKVNLFQSCKSKAIALDIVKHLVKHEPHIIKIW